MTKGNPDSATAAREIELRLSRRLRKVAIYGEGNCRLPSPVWNFEGYL
jgi:hypothetical protein